MQGKLILAGVALLCALGFGWYTKHLYDENAELHGANAALQQDVERLSKVREVEEGVAVRHVAKVVTIRKQQKDDNAEVQRIAPDWAGAAVPDAVLDALGL